MSAAALAGGWMADLVLGDPRHWHPVAGFGRCSRALERAIYDPTRRRGAAYAAALVGGAALLAELVARAGERAGLRRGAMLAAVSWTALGGRSLRREALGLASELEGANLAGAREALPALAGRDADSLDAAGLSRAAVESVADNTSDAVVGVLLWGAFAGPAGVGAYRAANTLDAMVGNRSPRYREFGWAAARLDDLLGWPPARATAAIAALCAPLVGGSPRRAWSTLRRDGGAHPSPNAGRTEAAFAGALGLRLGGPLAYAGRPEERPLLGSGGRTPSARDVRRAAHLSLAVGAAAAGLCAAALSWEAGG